MVYVSGVLLLILAAAEPQPQLVAVLRTKTPEGMDAIGDALSQAIVKHVLRASAPGTRVVSSADLELMLGRERERQLLGCDAGSSCLTEIAAALDADEVVSSSVIRVSAGLTGEQWLLELKRVHGRSGVRIGAGLVSVCGPPSVLLASMRVAAGEAWGEQPTAHDGRCPSAAAIIGVAGSGALLVAGGVGVTYSLLTRRAFDAQQNPQVVATVSRADAERAQAIFVAALAAATVGLGLGITSGWALTARPASPRVAFVLLPAGGALTLGGEF